MKYMGSKNRHAKEILPIILKDKKACQWYVEPFVGGCNLIDKVKGGKRIGADSHYYLIKMWKGIQSGWLPPETINEMMYKSIKDNKEIYEPAYVGFVGFGCSYSGKWFGGYARGKQNTGINKGLDRNYCNESRKNIIKQIDNIKDVVFYCCSYSDLYIPSKSIIYCDPPYNNTTSYKDNFNHNLFWNWCDRMVNLGHHVFVSEYTAPDNWECVWSKEVNNTLVKNTGSKKGVEKLFVSGNL